MTPSSLAGQRRARPFLTPILFAFAAACSRSRPEAAALEVMPSAPVAVDTVRAAASVLPRTLDVTGELRADAQIDLAAETDGRVVLAAFERGQAVAAGSVLVQLDAEEAEQRLAEAVATAEQTRQRLQLTAGATFDPNATPEVRSARITMERAEIEAQRYDRVVDSGAVSRTLRDQKHASWLEAKERHDAEVARARELFCALQAQEARVALARRTLADTCVQMPWSGMVYQRHVTAGQFVRRGERLATLVRIDPLRIVLTVPESATASMRCGQPLTLEVRSRPGETFAAEIAHIAPGLDPASRALSIEAVVPNKDCRLQPGSFAEARLELPGNRDSVVVPRSALVEDRGASRVVTVADGAAAWRFVQAGRTFASHVEIVRGLDADEVVVATEAEGIADGARILARVAKEQ